MNWVGIARAVIRRPHLWRAATRQVRRTAVPGWWHRWPLLPVPAGDYLRFRLVTQYGDERARPQTGDVLNYLEWVREWNR